MKKCLLLIGLIVSMKGQAFGAKKGKEAEKKGDLTAEFFEVIPKSFVLKPGVKIDGNNFRKATDLIALKIVGTLPQEMQAVVADSFLIQKNDLLKKITSGQQKDLNGITTENLLEKIKVEDESGLSVLETLFLLFKNQNNQGKNSIAFLKMLFESEAEGRSVLLQNQWNDFRLSALSDYIMQLRLEALFFPSIGTLIESNQFPLNQLDIRSLVRHLNYISNEKTFDLWNNRYKFYFNLMKIIIHKTNMNKSELSEISDDMKRYIDMNSADAKKRISEIEKTIKELEDELSEDSDSDSDDDDSDSEDSDDDDSDSDEDEDEDEDSDDSDSDSDSEDDDEDSDDEDSSEEEFQESKEAAKDKGKEEESKGLLSEITKSKLNLRKREPTKDSDKSEEPEKPATPLDKMIEAVKNQESSNSDDVSRSWDSFIDNDQSAKDNQPKKEEKEEQTSAQILKELRVVKDTVFDLDFFKKNRAKLNKAHNALTFNQKNQYTQFQNEVKTAEEAAKEALMAQTRKAQEKEGVGVAVSKMTQNQRNALDSGFMDASGASSSFWDEE